MNPSSFRTGALLASSLLLSPLGGAGSEPANPATVSVTRDFTITEPYLRFPISVQGEPRRIEFLIDGKVVRVENARLAEGHADFADGLNVEAFRGETVQLRAILPPHSHALDRIVAARTLTDAPNLYHETWRPQFHFTTAVGWTNDPNGMVFDGTHYHLCYQHNPLDLTGAGANMHWGHAVSSDMVHWKELPDIFYPNALGGIWSGSAVVERAPSGGLPKGADKVLAAFYTQAGPFTQMMQVSPDLGRTWFPVRENPVVPHIVSANRDPKVIWYAPAHEWVMALYLTGSNFALLTSTDLKSWTQRQTLSVHGNDPTFAECPDFFPLTVQGETTQKWVFTSASAGYRLGSFDGATFTPDATGGGRLVSDTDFYAAQTFSDMPDGRRVEIGWLRGPTYPGMPFTQQMSFPATLTLRRFSGGLAITRWPIAEIASLEGADHPLGAMTIQPGENPLATLPDGPCDITAEFEVPSSGEFGFTFHGLPVTYSVGNQTLTVKGAAAALRPEKGRVRLRLLVDRTSVEVFGNEGRVSFASTLKWPIQGMALELFTHAAPLHVLSLDVRQLRSIWP